MTIGQWLKLAEAELTAAGIGSARLDAILILELATGRQRESLLAHSDDEISPNQKAVADLRIDRRIKHEPLAHITGRREFFGLELEVNPDVLVPRVETEKIAELAIKSVPKNGRVLDMGTGSGALAIAVAKHRPDIKLVASDISPEALVVADLNAKRHQLSIDFVQSDLWQAINGQFAAVMTNLPYLSDEAMSQLMPEAKLEPEVALTGGRDGLDLYRAFLAALPAHLEVAGWLFTECDPWQQPALIAEATKAGLKLTEQDYFVMAFRKPTD